MRNDEPRRIKAARAKRPDGLLVSESRERRVADEVQRGRDMRELAQALMPLVAGANGVSVSDAGTVPRDEYGFVSPYREMAMARIRENEKRAFPSNPDVVLGDAGLMATPAEVNRVDTDRALRNATALMRAFKERKSSKGK